MSAYRFRVAGQAEAAAQQRSDQLHSQVLQLQQQLQEQCSVLAESKEQVCCCPLSAVKQQYISAVMSMYAVKQQYIAAVKCMSGGRGAVLGSMPAYSHPGRRGKVLICMDAWTTILTLNK